MLGSLFCLKQPIRWFSFVFYLRLDPSQGRITWGHAKIWHRNCAQFSLCLTPWRAMAACGMPRASFKRLFWVQVAMVAMVIATLFFGWVDDRWGQKVPLAGSLVCQIRTFRTMKQKNMLAVIANQDEPMIYVKISRTMDYLDVHPGRYIILGTHTCISRAKGILWLLANY